MAFAKDTVNRAFLELVSSLDPLAPKEKLQILERLLGATLCADFDPDHEAEILRDIARRITAVNGHIRKQLEQDAAEVKLREPGTAH